MCTPFNPPETSIFPWSAPAAPAANPKKSTWLEAPLAFTCAFKSAFKFTFEFAFKFAFQPTPAAPATAPAHLRHVWFGSLFLKAPLASVFTGHQLAPPFLSTRQPFSFLPLMMKNGFLHFPENTSCACAPPETPSPPEPDDDEEECDPQEADADDDQEEEVLYPTSPPQFHCNSYVPFLSHLTFTISVLRLVLQPFGTTCALPVAVRRSLSRSILFTRSLRCVFIFSMLGGSHTPWYPEEDVQNVE